MDAYARRDHGVAAEGWAVKASTPCASTKTKTWALALTVDRTPVLAKRCPVHQQAHLNAPSLCLFSLCQMASKRKRTTLWTGHHMTKKKRGVQRMGQWRSCDQGPVTVHSFLGPTKSYKIILLYSYIYSNLLARGTRNDFRRSPFFSFTFLWNTAQLHAVPQNKWIREESESSMVAQS